MSLVIYTAIFGNYDILVPPKVVNKNIKYVCFTDKKMKCYSWEIRVVKPEFKDPMRENRKYKILSHKYFEEYQYSIYIDGNFEILLDLSQHIETLLGKNDIAVLRHPFRDCIYKEAKMCIKKKKDNVELIKKQMKRYKAEGYPKNNGLAANGLIIRKHTKQIKKFNEMWWNEVKNYSKRDQLSFGYIIYKLGLKYSLIPNSKSYSTKYVRYLSHKKKPKMIYLDKLLKVIKKYHTKNSLIFKMLAAFQNYIYSIQFINSKFIKRNYLKIRVPLCICYFFQFL